MVRMPLTAHLPSAGCGALILCPEVSPHLSLSMTPPLPRFLCPCSPASPPPPLNSVNILAKLDWHEGTYHCLLTMSSGMIILHPDLLLSGAGRLRPQGQLWQLIGMACVCVYNKQASHLSQHRPIPHHLKSRVDCPPDAAAALPPAPAAAAPAGTRITTSSECQRRSFLDERVAEDGSNDKAVKGTLQHNLIQVWVLVGAWGAGGLELRGTRPAFCSRRRSLSAAACCLLTLTSLQAALTEGLRTPPQLHACAERLVGEATEALLEVGLSEGAALAYLKEATPGILRWVGRQAGGWGLGAVKGAVVGEFELTIRLPLCACASPAALLQVDAPLPAPGPCHRLAAVRHRRRQQPSPALGGGAGAAARCAACCAFACALVLGPAPCLPSLVLTLSWTCTCLPRCRRWLTLRRAFGAPSLASRE